MSDAERSSTSFAASLTDDGEQRIIHVSGEIDISTAPQLEACIMEALAVGPPVVVDLSGTTFLDSTGVTVFLRAYFSAGQIPEAIVLVGATGMVQRTLELTKVADALTVREDLPDAQPEPDPQG